jgi:hypothetical protein
VQIRRDAAYYNSAGLKSRWIILIAIFLVQVRYAHAQSADSLLLRSDPVLAELDSILNSPDSLSIISLLDSLIALSEQRSQLAARVGYNSNVSSATNTVNINKFGLSPGVSYYHKSGVYADVGAYWSNEYDPQLYLTVPAVGYIAVPTTKWSILGEYSHYFYNKPDSIKGTGTATNTPYTDNLYLSNFVDFGLFTTRLDYSFLFGQQTANRFYAAVGLDFMKKKWLGMDRFRFFPTAGILYGNETVTTYPKTRPFIPKTTKPWGILNYNLVAPVSLSWKNWNILASYTYNFPQPLPGERLDLSHSGYVTLTLTRYFDM